MTNNAVEVPGYSVGTWTIDAIHSDVSFVVRHLGVSKVRGHFADVEGTIQTAEDPLKSAVSVVIKTASVSTKNEQRDEHVRSADFLDVENHPELTFESSGLESAESGLLLHGMLTVRGVSKPVALVLEPNGFGDGYGAKVAGFSATTEINRKDFGVTGGAAGVMLGETVSISLEIEAVLAG